jgi:hypothetical protein
MSTRPTLAVTDHGYELWAPTGILGALTTVHSREKEDYVFLFEGSRSERWFLQQLDPSRVNRHDLVKLFALALKEERPDLTSVAFHEKVTFAVDQDGFRLLSKQVEIGRAERSPEGLQWVLNDKVTESHTLSEQTLSEALTSDYRHWLMQHCKPYAGHQLRYQNENVNYSSKNIYFFSPGSEQADLKLHCRVPSGDSVRSILIGSLFGRPFAYAVTFSALPADKIVPRLRGALEQLFGIPLTDQEVCLSLHTFDLYQDEQACYHLIEYGSSIGYYPGPARPVGGQLRKHVRWTHRYLGHDIGSIPNLAEVLLAYFTQLYRVTTEGME